MGPASTTMTIGGTWSQRRNTFKYCVLVGIKTSKTKPWLLRDRDYSQIKIPCWDSSELITWFQLNQHIRNWEMTNINANLLCSTLHKNNQWVPRQNKSLICTKHRKLELELISDLQDDKTELLYWINEYQGRTSPDLQYRREVRHRREQPPQSALPLLLTSKIVHVVSLLWRIIIEPPWIWAEVIETQYPTTIAHWPCGGRRAGTVGQLQLTAGQCCLRREGHRTEIHMRWWCEMVARIQRGGRDWRWKK
jgi:hypothetical protein